MKIAPFFKNRSTRRFRIYFVSCKWNEESIYILNQPRRRTYTRTKANSCGSRLNWEFFFILRVDSLSFPVDNVLMRMDSFLFECFSFSIFFHLNDIAKTLFVWKHVKSTHNRHLEQLLDEKALLQKCFCIEKQWKPSNTAK